MWSEKEFQFDRCVNMFCSIQSDKTPKLLLLGLIQTKECFKMIIIGISNTKSINLLSMGLHTYYTGAHEPITINLHILVSTE